MVRPRFQMEEDITDAQPRNPNARVNWCAVGVVSEAPTGRPSLLHDGAGEGRSTLVRHTELDVLASFYGPRSGGLAALLRDGLYVPQNREGLFLQGMGLIDVGIARRVPDIVNTSARRRTDLGFRLRRRTERVLPILNLKQAVGTLTGAGGTENGVAIHVEPFETPEN